jgi:hypothetical protein
MTLNVNDVRVHYSFRQVGIAASHCFKDVAVIRDDALPHLFSPFGAKDGVADGLVDCIHNDVHDRVMSSFGNATVELHIQFAAEFSTFQLLLLS